MNDVLEGSLCWPKIIAINDRVGMKAQRVATRNCVVIRDGSRSIVEIICIMHSPDWWMQTDCVDSSSPMSLQRPHFLEEKVNQNLY